MTKATDPVCGMEVDVHRAWWTRQAGSQTYYFCSAVCLQTFDENLTKVIDLESMKTEKGTRGEDDISTKLIRCVRARIIR